ncbi:hypothetical protein, partial [Streptomyces anulatus]|uniref:hypothetical protein n=1 Tax=Streptomyces anulatus TaxID=1892 RepID=UPI003326E08A
MSSATTAVRSGWTAARVARTSSTVPSSAAAPGLAASGFRPVRGSINGHVTGGTGESGPVEDEPEAPV